MVGKLVSDCLLVMPSSSEAVIIVEYTELGGQLRKLVIGAETEVRLADGDSTTAVNFDNAATTPPLTAVMAELTKFAPWYASVHRGKGHKSILTSELYEQARQVVKQFVGAADTDLVVFTKSTTESINLLATILAGQGKQPIVIATAMEHLANDLPWRRQFKVLYAGLDQSGRLSLADLEHKLIANRGKVALVTVTGASNVTGICNPVHEIARLAHKYGAKILVDGAQLVPHLPVLMHNEKSAEQIDFLAFSAHKLYAPFGTGVLVGSSELLQQADPLLWGGGAVGLTSHSSVLWEPPPGRYEAGTPNVMGVIALTAAIRQLTAIGLAKIHRYESELLTMLLEGLQTIEGVSLYHGHRAHQVSLVSLTLAGVDHELLAEILAQEAGIAVRNGLFCAHPYVVKLLNPTVTEQDWHQLSQSPIVPGLVRISLGLYNTHQEVALFLAAMRRIVADSEFFKRKYANVMRYEQRCSCLQSNLC